MCVIILEFKYLLLHIIIMVHLTPTRAMGVTPNFNIQPVIIDENGNAINETYKYNNSMEIENTKVIENNYKADVSPNRNRNKHGMSRLERVALEEYHYQKYLEKCHKERKDTGEVLEQVREWNKKKGYTISKGTCDRRAVKVCKNACVKTYRYLCEKYKCRRAFQEKVKNNCAKICEREFKIEFNNLF